MDPVAVASLLPQASFLTDLPTELLVEIITYHTNSFDFLSPLVTPEDIEHRRTQRQDLCSLSQSCIALRSVCLPLLWKRFDISVHNFGQLRQTEITKHIFSYIKSVHISMQQWSTLPEETLSVLPVFLSALPNLTGLRIYDINSVTNVEVLSSVLVNHCFPTVTSLSIPDTLHAVFPAFPNVKTLACPAIYLRSPVLDPARTHLPRLDALVGVRLDSVYDFISALARDFPRLRAVSIASPFRSDDKFGLATLGAFTHLSELGLFYGFDPNELLSLEELVSGGRDVLQASRSLDAKVVRVWSNQRPAGPSLIRVERC
ncbi:hypothetical protein B0H19DRAFT_1129167 [Mycena capillaripes]|nr:hypothetical protein B0H19DRAFT_1129167 [Mycena capillaripes]